VNKVLHRLLRGCYICLLGVLGFGALYYEFVLTGGDPIKLLSPFHHVVVLIKLVNDPTFLIAGALALSIKALGKV